jgi:hypothetical protein
MAKSPPICEKIEQHLWKFKKVLCGIIFCNNRHFVISLFRDLTKIGQLTPNFVGFAPAPRGWLPIICKNIHQLFITVNCRVFFMLKKSIVLWIIYLHILSYLAWIFFANKGQFTPRGMGQSYKVWCKSATVLFFTKIAKLSQNNDFCDQSDQIFFCNWGRSPLGVRGQYYKVWKKIIFDRRFLLLYCENSVVKVITKEIPITCQTFTHVTTPTPKHHGHPPWQFAKSIMATPLWQVAKNHHGHPPLTGDLFTCSLKLRSRDHLKLQSCDQSNLGTRPLGGAARSPIKGDNGRFAGSYRLRTSVNIFDQLK